MLDPLFLHGSLGGQEGSLKSIWLPVLMDWARNNL